MNNKEDCKYFEKMFVSYANGNISDKDRDFCQNHLNTCSECKTNENYSELLFVWNKLDKIPEILPSKNFMAKLLHEVAVLEEKRRVFWFKIDFFFTLAKIPIMCLIFASITFTTNVSYAKNGISLEKIDIRKPNPIVEEKLREVTDMKIIDIMDNLFKYFKESNIRG